jgi:hypothetical protein
MGIDIETHCVMPSMADTWWRPGQFGFMTRLTKEVLTELRVVQIGWTIGTFGSAPTTKERLVRLDGFEISEAAAKKHGISHSDVVSQGEPLARCLRELVDDVSALKLQGGRVCVCTQSSNETLADAQNMVFAVLCAMFRLPTADQPTQFGCFVLTLGVQARVSIPGT